MNKRSFFVSSVVVLSISLVFFCSSTHQASAFTIGNFTFPPAGTSFSSWWQKLFGGGNSAPCTSDPTDNAPAVLQTIAGYTTGPLLAKYPVPSGSSNRAPGVLDTVK